MLVPILLNSLPGSPIVEVQIGLKLIGLGSSTTLNVDEKTFKEICERAKANLALEDCDDDDD